MCHYAMFTACRLRLISVTGHAKFSLSSADLTKSYYDALGVTPRATQNDIKAAYYKLSMKFHPDKNKDSEEAIEKFRDITEAYEVLGNFRLKKLYDKGLLHTAGSQYATAKAATVEDDEQTKFYKSRLRRDKPPPPTGRTPIYNFDEWAHAHYGATFARQAAAKQKHEQKKEQMLRKSRDIESERVIYGLLFTIICCCAFNAITSESNDIVDSGEENDDK